MDKKAPEKKRSMIDEDSEEKRTDRRTGRSTHNRKKKVITTERRNRSSLTAPLARPISSILRWRPPFTVVVPTRRPTRNDSDSFSL